MNMTEKYSPKRALHKGARIFLAATAMVGVGNTIASAQENTSLDRNRVQFCLDAMVGKPEGIPTNVHDKTPLNLRVSGATNAAQKRLVTANLHPTSQKTLRAELEGDCDGIAVKRDVDVTFYENGHKIKEIDNFLRPGNDHGQELSTSFREQINPGSTIKEVLEYHDVNPQTGLTSSSRDVLAAHLDR